MDYYLTPFLVDSGKAVSNPHASPVVCQYHSNRKKSPGVVKSLF